MAVSRWGIVLDPAVAPDARAEAWRALRKRIRQPVLFQLRRRIEGWRSTDELADEVCERVRERFEGKGVAGEAACLRGCVEREVTRLCEEQGKSGAIDPEFGRDWASGLFFVALKEFARTDPEAHQLILRLFNRPEGAAPLDPADLARRLGKVAPEVEQRLDDARRELRRLFEAAVAQTVADESRLRDETAQLLPCAQALFGAGAR